MDAGCGWDQAAVEAESTLVCVLISSSPHGTDVRVNVRAAELCCIRWSDGTGTSQIIFSA